MIHPIITKKKNLDLNIFDCETYQKNNNVIIYCISYSIDNEIFTVYKDSENEKDIFMNFLNKIIEKINKNEITFYIHNINFDGMLIMDSVFKNNLKFKWFVIGTNIYTIVIEYLGNFIKFKCSYKFIPVSLKKINFNKNKKTIFPYKFINENNINYIGEFPDIKYFNEEINYSDYEKYKNENLIFDVKKETIKYCENDVILTLELIKNIINTLDYKYFNIFKKSYSLPSLSYKIFFKYWNNYKIKEKILKEEDLYIRKSYYGGRCEVFGNKKKNEIVHYFDFSGMYEQCMLQKFPTGDGQFKNNNLNYNEIGFHCIKFKSDMEYPILPHHSENGKLLFANGIFVGCYWYEEIKLFVENGGEIIDIYSSYTFEKQDLVFKDFINEFKKIKIKGGIYKIFGKLIINSLYGGFAMNEKEYESFVCFSDKEAEKLNEKTDVLEYYKKNKCHIFKILKNKKSNILINKEEKKWSNTLSTRNVTYASIISSKARIKLYLAMKEVLNSGGRLFYCDTDSIAAGYNSIKINQKFGEVIWSEIWKKSVFISPKFYAYVTQKNEEIIKIKGISNKKYNFDTINKAFYSNKKNLIYKKELSFSKKKFDLKQNYIKKIILINNYNKRIFTKNKLKTKPLYITHPI